MTDSNTDGKQNGESAFLDPAMPDWYLQALVNIVNGKDIEFPVTLFVGGLIVSGQLVSGHRYFEEGLCEQFSKFFGKDQVGSDEAIKNLTSPGDIYRQPKDDNQPGPQYIHLRCARVFAPGQQPIPSEGSWWRGRLASVDGFHFGSLGVNQGN